jgi:hypothetical protein
MLDVARRWNRHAAAGNEQSKTDNKHATSGAPHMKRTAQKQNACISELTQASC